PPRGREDGPNAPPGGAEGEALALPSKIGHPDPDPNAGSHAHPHDQHHGRIGREFMRDRGPQNKAGGRDGDPADQAGTARLDARAGLVHRAATETWPTRTSSVVLRTRFRSRLTRDVS